MIKDLLESPFVFIVGTKNTWTSIEQCLLWIALSGMIRFCARRQGDRREEERQRKEFRPRILKLKLYLNLYVALLAWQKLEFLIRKRYTISLMSFLVSHEQLCWSFCSYQNAIYPLSFLHVPWQQAAMVVAFVFLVMSMYRTSQQFSVFTWLWASAEPLNSSICSSPCTKSSWSWMCA